MLMDAVEAVMQEKGYAAVSARNVAERAGLNYQLVFYYFPSMDELLLATYRRRTERVLEGVEAALSAERPLHAFWEAASEPSDAALTMEYMALSNHNEIIRAETIRFGEAIRRTVAERLAERFADKAPESAVLTPLAISLALNNIGAILGLESALGISGGHAALKDLVGWCLQHLEPSPL
jgi:AcrR family transcriptional regulator